MARVIQEFYVGAVSESEKPIVLEQAWNHIRTIRDELMRNTDWTQTVDCPLPDEKKTEFVAYRQALRDIPQTYSDPDLVVWPEKPTI
ncbi:tail fiber assembly protein [Vibrio parahaemolyticus]|uniref:tail fiber assembly protein n=1 Tax=Vibrio parahaemolyticus TaxID=670 RepID=UPI00387AB3D9